VAFSATPKTLYRHTHGHVLQKEDNDWVKKCSEYEVEGFRSRSRPKMTWKEVMENSVKHVN